MSDPAGSARPAAPGASSPRPVAAKGPAAFRTISEASAELGVPQHVLRFWETRFAFVRPTKRAGGRRFYRPQDLEVLRSVRVLLQDEGYTIRGVQKLHREGGLKRLLAAGGVGAAEAARLAAAAAPDPEPTAEGGRSDAAAPDAETRPEPGGGADPPSDPPTEDEPQTRDLFDEPPLAPLAPAAAPERRPVLDKAARDRLSDVLDNLEATKARIDALLDG